MAKIPIVRDSMYSGLMYPDDETELRTLFASYLNGKPPPERCLRALVSPHAALPYAGPIIASAWSQICIKKTEKIVIIADLHPKTAKTLFPGSHYGIVLTQADYFATPLGAVPVDQETCRELEACSTLFTTSDAAHEEEFGIELQALFAVYLLPGVPIVPILLYGTHDIAIQTLARSLDYLFPEPNSSTVFIASCNLGTGIDASAAQALRNIFIHMIMNNALVDFLQYLRAADSNNYSPMSLGVLLSMKALQRRTRSIIMTADSSNFVQGAAKLVVNYGSAGWYDE